MCDFEFKELSLTIPSLVIVVSVELFKEHTRSVETVANAKHPSDTSYLHYMIAAIDSAGLMLWWTSNSEKVWRRQVSCVF